jgi:hypothetical protein
MATKEKLEFNEKMFAFFKAPKSVCACGHQGDGFGSHHKGVTGHGKCRVPDCDCSKFTWSEFTPSFASVLK